MGRLVKRSKAVAPRNSVTASGISTARMCGDSSLEARIGEQIVPLESGCWFHISGAEYPIVRISEQDRPVKLHRWVYETLVGPIPPRRHLHHLCMDPRCVNPSHLQPLTPSQHRRAHMAANGR